MHNFTYPEVLALAKTIEEENPKELIVPDRLHQPHPLIREFKDNTESYTEFRTDITRIASGANYLRIEVTKYTLKRSLIFYNAFITLAKARGHEVTVKDKETLLIIRGRKLKVRLREPNKVHDKKDQQGWNVRSYSTSGELVFMLESFYTEKEWRDTKNVKLESKLAVIMAFLELKADEEIQSEIQDEVNRKIREKEEELKEYKQQIFEKEKADYLSLVNDAKRWSKFVELNTYIKQLEVDGSKSKEWLEWVQAKADWLDPRTNNEDPILGDYNKFDDKYLKDSPKVERRYNWF